MKRLRVLAILALAAGTVMAGVAFNPPRIEGRLQPDRIRPESGHAWIADVRADVPFPYVVRGSEVGVAPSGVLVLTEDGLALGPADAPHDTIRREGRGAYSHWSDSLYFSTIDNSDPRSNGRRYEYSVRAAAPASLKIVSMVLAAAGGLLLAALRGTATATGNEVQPLRHAGPARDRLAIACFVGAALAVALLVWLHIAPPLLRFEVTADHLEAGPGNTRIVDLRHCCRRLAGLVRTDPALLQVYAMNGERYVRAPSPAALMTSRQHSFAVAGSNLVLSAPPPEASSLLVVGRPAPSRAAGLLSVLLLVVGGLLATRRETLLAATRPWQGAGWRAATAVAVACVALTTICVSAVVGLWMTGQSAPLSLSGYLPVSDALGYYRCAVAGVGFETTAEHGHDVDYCSRRALYPNFLATILWLLDWRAAYALLALGGIAALSIAALGLAVARAHGPVAALVAVFGCLVFAKEWALGNFMTESLGLAAGCTGAACLLYFATTRGTSWLVIGLALVSAALTSRAGALFVYPLLIAWAYWFSARTHWFSPRAAGLVLASIAVGPASQAVAVWAMGGDIGHTGGNFSTVLYGLSTGSRDWSESYRVFAKEFATMPEREVFRIVQDKALENIAASPSVLIGSLRNAFVSFFLLPGYLLPGTAHASPWFLVPLGVGVCRCLLRTRDARHALLLAVLVGELASVPWIIDSGGPRVLAATVWSRVVIVGIGLSTMVAVIPALLRTARATPPAHVSRAERALPVGLAGGLLALVLLPATPLRYLMRIPVVEQAATCPEGSQHVTARLGKESIALGAQDSPSLPFDGVLTLMPGQLEADETHRGAWWHASIGKLASGTYLLYVFDVNSRAAGRFHPIVLERGQSLPSEASTVTLCVGATDRSRQVGDHFPQRAQAVIPN